LGSPRQLKILKCKSEHTPELEPRYQKKESAGSGVIPMKRKRYLPGAVSFL